VLAGATLAHIGNGWVFSAPNGGWEYPVFLIAASFIHVLLGDGAFAIKTAAAPVMHRLKTG
jgi:putative oxidoreductase